MKNPLYDAWLGFLGITLVLTVVVTAVRFEKCVLNSCGGDIIFYSTIITLCTGYITSYLLLVIAKGILRLIGIKIILQHNIIAVCIILIFALLVATNLYVFGIDEFRDMYITGRKYLDLSY